MILTIDGKQYRNFTEYTIDLNFDTIAHSFSFTGVNKLLDNHLTYPRVTITNDDGELLITGTIINTPIRTQISPDSVTVSGYSLPGILEDCSIPVSIYPLQSDNLSLKEIVEKLLKPFGLSYTYTTNIETEFNKKYVKSTAGDGQSVKDYINDLASQRNIILTSDELGRLIFTKIDTKKLYPVYLFQEGDEGIMEMSIELPGQSMHSEITVMRQASSDNPDAGEKTITNPYCPVFRPKIVQLNSGDIHDLNKASRAALIEEISQIKLRIYTMKYIKPGQVVNVIAPSLNINTWVRFFVEQCSIRGKNGSETYDLTCVLSDVYSDNPIENVLS